MNEFEKLREFGQSFWYDNIQRSLIESGDLKRMIDAVEIYGVTSNPSIFHNAISKSHDYDSVIESMSLSGWTDEEIFYQLAIEDVRSAADLFLPVYHATHGLDGYVSLEVSPFLARNTEGTIREATSLWKRVNRPNLMIKIPATVEGLPAVSAAVAAGINVNVTLIFSLERYAAVTDAYMDGLEKRLAEGLSLSTIASVASFFVSRVDTKVDGMLRRLIENGIYQANEVAHMFGTSAVANARLAYSIFEEEFSSPRFNSLFARGARVQRPLWASTSTKDPNYPDLIYVEELIGQDTVNTVPPKTLDAFRDHGHAMPTLPGKIGVSREVFNNLENLGISMKQVCTELEDEGVNAFAEAYTALLQSISARKAEFLNKKPT